MCGNLLTTQLAQLVHHTNTMHTTSLSATAGRCAVSPLNSPSTTRRRTLRASRHPDYVNTSENQKPAIVQDRPDLEADVRYRRVDNSDELAAEARHAFAAGLAVGEAGMQLARQALLIAAEDDAIASSSVVRFPVDAFLSRIQRLAADTAAAVAAAVAAAAAGQSAGQAAASSSNQPWASIRSLPPSEVIAAVEHTLFKQQQQQQPAQPAWYSSIPCAGYRTPPYGRSNLPARSVVDHAGVWEDARQAYLHEVLVRKSGTPAALVILYSEVYRQLLLMGAIDFAVTFDYGDFNSLPAAQPLPNLTLKQLLLRPAQPGDASSSQLLNTCSSEALVEMLRHLKRAYWPWPWDTNIDCFDRGGVGSTGGFRAAAKAALGSDEMSAALRAVSATAAHRLQRGIWTSPGAGDLNRCLAAAERLVMMVGDQQPQERRDLAVLYLHAGQPAAAAAELSAYLDSVRNLRAWPASGQQQQDPFDVRLSLDMWKMLNEAGVKAGGEVMSVEAVLSRGGEGAGALQTPAGRAEDAQSQHKPLIW